MNPLLANFFDWLVRASWQGAILVCVVLGAQRLLGQKLSPGWRYGLWVLVLLKLVLPVAPRTPVSLFNLASDRAVELARAGASRDPAISSSGLTTTGSSRPRQGAVGGVLGVDRFGLSEPRSAFLLAWALGLVLLGVRMIGQTVRFARLVRRAEPVPEPTVLGVLTSCQNLVGISGAVGLVQTPAVDGPALYGFFRPRLLLPEGMLESFSLEELRHIFLHELAHVKRRDMLVQWLVGLLRLVHWFNPVLAYGFRRMARDREMACDATALSRAGDQERRSYGETILKVLQTCRPTARSAVVVGIMENHTDILQRILLIARFRKASRFSLLGVLVLVLLGLVALTDAESAQPKPLPDPPSGASQTNSKANSLNSGEPSSSPGPSLQKLRRAYSETLKQLADLTSEQDELLEHYTILHPKVRELRDRIARLEHRSAELQAQIQAQEETDHAAAAAREAQQAFRKRYGLRPVTVPNQPSSTNDARAKAMAEFRRRYGLDRAPITNSASGGTGLNSEAEAALRQRYGLAAPGAEGKVGTTAPLAFGDETSFSNRDLPLLITVGPKGELGFGTRDQPVTLDQLELRLRDEVQKNPELRLSISADRNAPFGQIVRVMDAAKVAQIKIINAFTRDPEKP